MDELISVIIPMYNAAGWIEKCLDSLLCQSYRNLEILVVDDGSQDNGLAICQEYARRDERIVVAHQENQGVSAARNFGLERSKGRYIAFVDADDYVKPDYFAVLYEKIIAYQADMVCCNMIELQSGVKVRPSGPRVLGNRRITDAAQLYRDSLLQKEGYSNVVWAKLIKAELAKKYRFPLNMKFGEDHIYIYKLFSESPVVYLDTYAGYYYIRSDASVTYREYDNNIVRYLDEMEMYRYKALNLPPCAVAYKKGFFEHYAHSVCAAAMEILKKGHDQSTSDQYGIIKARAGEIPMSLLGIKGRVKIQLLRHFPSVFAVAYGLKGKCIRQKR